MQTAANNGIKSCISFAVHGFGNNDFVGIAQSKNDIFLSLCFFSDWWCRGFQWLMIFPWLVVHFKLGSLQIEAYTFSQCSIIKSRLYVYIRFSVMKCLLVGVIWTFIILGRYYIVANLRKNAILIQQSPIINIMA